MSKVFAVGLGGFLGAIVRYALTGLIHRSVGLGFPFGTLAVNSIGCFALGTITELATGRVSPDSPVRCFLTAGLIGGFTTFSAVAGDTFDFLRAERWLAAAASAGGNVFLGIGAAGLGHAAGKVLAA